jgi:NadR type nicotinamide-nucleotide adenylyltransferase
MDENENSLLKVAIVGPECTGKSDLASFLATHYNTVWVPEYARAYLDNLVRPYEEHDLLTIAHGQLRLEKEWSLSANGLLFCDTTLLVIKIWSEVKYGRCDPEILHALNNSHYDLHLLTYVDIPWEDDPQREHPDKREMLYSIYHEQLTAMNLPFVEIKGERDARRKKAIEAVEALRARRRRAKSPLY